MLRFLRIGLVCTMPLTLAIAHDLYLLPNLFHVSKRAKIQIAIHNGDSFPGREVAPVIARLRDGQLLGSESLSEVQNLRVSGKETVGEVTVSSNGSLLLSVRTIPNRIGLPPDKFLAYLKEEGLNQVIQWRQAHGETDKPGRERYSKYAKALLLAGASNNFYQHQLGFPIEIVPLADPYAIRAGGTLPVRIFFRGRPAANLQLEAAWSSGSESKTIIAGVTDQSGNISVPIMRAGKWRLHSLKMERCTEPAAADWESFWASLTFQTP